MWQAPVTHRRPSRSQAPTLNSAASRRNNHAGTTGNTVTSAVHVGLARGDPIQPRPAATRPSRTVRMSGIPSSHRSARRHSWPRIGASDGATGHRLLEFLRSGRAKGDHRCLIALGETIQPDLGRLRSGLKRPGATWSSGFGSHHRASVAGDRPHAVRQRAPTDRQVSPSALAVSASSSSSGSFIIQWATRRSNSSCGPPPSSPGSTARHGRPRSATRPSPTRSAPEAAHPRRRSSPVRRFGSMSISRNQRPQSAGLRHRPLPVSPAVTGCGGRGRTARQEPVLDHAAGGGSPGMISPRGERARLRPRRNRARRRSAPPRRPRRIANVVDIDPTAGCPRRL